MRDVEGDGNCMFRAISDYLDGNEKNHMNYRKLAVRAMNENRDFFSLFVEDDITFDEFLDLAMEDGEWGGNLELQALA